MKGCDYNKWRAFLASIFTLHNDDVSNPGEYMHNERKLGKLDFLHILHAEHFMPFATSRPCLKIFIFIAQFSQNVM